MFGFLILANTPHHQTKVKTEFRNTTTNKIPTKLEATSYSESSEQTPKVHDQLQIVVA